MLQRQLLAQNLRLVSFLEKKKEKPAKLLLENLGINKKTLNSMVFHLQLSIFILDS